MWIGWILVINILAGLTAASPIRKRSACSNYTIINTRGTWEAPGESSGFKTMNANVLNQVPGGKIYNTDYPAALLQISGLGTTNIIKHIEQTLALNPDECFILEGYSQGAAATVNALPSITGAGFNAVKGVFLIGDPEHKPGLACNWDNFGYIQTRDSLGAEAVISAGIPDNWVGKAMDVCIAGDLVCDLLHPTPAGLPPGLVHAEYPDDAPTQYLGTNFVIEKLKSG